MEEKEGTFYSTYGWHPRSVAAAIATLRGLKANRARLLQLEFERPAAVRIQGLAIGIDVGDEDYADTIHDKCRRNGLLVSTEGSTVLLLPSLVIDKRTAAHQIERARMSSPLAAVRLSITSDGSSSTVDPSVDTSSPLRRHLSWIVSA